jgi:E3 ubiquitin-protein ligase Topors
LRVWSLVDVEVLTGHILVLIKAIDIRSEPAVRLLGELLDTDEYPRGAEQFAHELYSWLRSPYKDLRRYDEIAQVSPSLEEGLVSM